MNDNRKCRWGIMSTAQIANKNWQAIKLAGNAVVAAVASRSAEKAQSFIDTCQATVPFDDVPRAHGSYEALLEDDGVDAVYIPLPTGMRKDLVIRSAQAGKHVMCEKPCAGSAEDLAAMISACKDNGVQFMDGVMYMHGNRLPEIRKALDNGEIGTIKRIAAQFSFCAGDDFRNSNIRTDSRMEPHGCLGDLGWYTLRFAIWVMGGEMPESVTARMLSSHRGAESPDAVPMEFAAELQFANGVTASSYNSFETAHQQWANISGTEGQLHVSDFVLPYFNSDQESPSSRFRITKSEFKEVGCDFAMHENSKTVSVAEHGNSHEHAQEVNLFRNFSAIVNSGQLDDSWPDWALKTQRVLDACWASAKSDGQRVSL
ncbi:MAG: Gfo/Idh/MocA family oxidoreductase [Planctomycetota bacterium]